MGHFIFPAVTGVGLGLSEARASGIYAEASSLTLHLLLRTTVEQSTGGFVTLIRDKSDDHIVGACVLAEGGKLVLEAYLAVRDKIKTTVLAVMFQPHLTWNEA